MKTTQRGRAAEAQVAEELKRRGFQIIQRNWRARACEIDIVAHKDSVAYLVEVKYRSSPGQGDSLEYITPTKLKQMNFAVQVWAQLEGWSGDTRLMAAGVDGQTGQLELIEID